MRSASRTVYIQESSKGVGGLTVSAYSLPHQGPRNRVGSAATAPDGTFRIEYKSIDEKMVWNLQLEVAVDGAEPKVLYLDAKPRSAAGYHEAWTIRIPFATLVSAGVLGAQNPEVVAAELPALGTFLARATAETSYEAEVQSAVRARLDPIRDDAQATASAFRSELVLRNRGGVAPPPELPASVQLAAVIVDGLVDPRESGSGRGRQELARAQAAR